MLKSIWVALIGLLFSHYLSAQAPVFANDKMNVVYMGVSNPISLYYSEPYDTVTTTNGYVSKIRDGYYKWWPREYRKSCLVLRSANGDSLAAAYFRVKRMPTPTPLLGGVSRGGLMGAGEFQAQQGVAARIVNSDPLVKFEVVGYNVTHQPQEKGEVRTYYNKGAMFNGKAYDLIKAARPGDIYHFDNIQYKDIDGAVFDLPSIIITIK